MEAGLIDAATIGQLVLARRHGSPDLPAEAAVQWHRALARLPWAEAHRQVVGASDRQGTLLASVTRETHTARLDGTSLRVHLLGAISAYGGGDDAGAVRELLTQLIATAKSDGVDVVVIAGDDRTPVPEGALRVPVDDVTLRVIEDPRRGAPMLPVRSGERDDERAMAAMPPLGGDGAGRVHFERPADYLDFSLTRLRLRAGLDRPGARQLQFVVAEEGGRAAAYVVVSVIGSEWVVEACGDFDASGARIGAIMQSLVAAAPSERRPVISGWWPSPVMPPQMERVSADTSADHLWVYPLTSRVGSAMPCGLTLWRGDLP